MRTKWGPFQQFGPDEDQVLNWGPLWKHCIKKVWNAIGEIGIALQFPGWILELHDWTRLEQIMDMTENEFIAEVTEDEEIFLEWVQELGHWQAEEDQDEID